MKKTINREAIEHLLSKHYSGFANAEWTGVDVTFDFDFALTKKDVQELIEENSYYKDALNSLNAVNNWLRETIIIGMKTNIVQMPQIKDDEDGCEADQ